MGSVINDDVHINGHLTSKTVGIPDGAVVDDDINGSAGIAYTKLEHLYNKMVRSVSTAGPSDLTKIIHIVKGATATVLTFDAGHVVALTGTESSAVDLLKNGVSILTAPIALDTGDGARELVAAAIASANLVQDDVLEVEFDFTAGAGAGAGQFAVLTLKEDAA